MRATCIYITLLFVLLNIGASYATICGSGRPPCQYGYFCKVCKHNTGNCVPLQASDCLDVLNAGFTRSGVYPVTTWSTNTSIQVYCDMDTDGGGWTVIQRRIDGSLSFSRNWTEYENGFGDVNDEYWLGLLYIKEMADRGTTQLRLTMTDVDDTTVYRQFDNFYLTSNSYVLNIGAASGDPLSYTTLSYFYHNGMPFTTFDNDNDLNGADNCAVVSGGGGWWHRSCYFVHLNGEYGTPGTPSTSPFGWPYGILHLGFTNDPYKSSSMMLRLTN